MIEELDNILLLLECTLINSICPDYIEISVQYDTIYILLSKNEYKHYKINERIQSVFSLLKFEHSDILEKYPIIVECLDSAEMDGLFKMYRSTNES